MGFKAETSNDYFRNLSSQDLSVQLSGELKNLAVILMKISNDLRWMNSGPLAGIAEVELQARSIGIGRGRLQAGGRAVGCEWRRGRGSGGSELVWV